MKLSELNNTLYEFACRSESNVLIEGATGTGKTFLAQKIHQGSNRAHRPFVSINLASLHEGTIESELFGHERGSFTGAELRRTGRLLLAQGGTIFLDEIGELSLKLQARLLEFLQCRQVTPVGGNQPVSLDVRIIAATHRDLKRMVLQGTFREDLFHRLRVIAMRLPTLKERSGAELNEMIHTGLSEASLRFGKPILRISAEVAEMFEAYPWKGNIRELRHVLEFCVQSSHSAEISKKDLPQWFIEGMSESVFSILGGIPVLGVAEIPLTLDFKTAVCALEKEHLSRALARNGGRINRTAREIKLSKATLLRKMKAYRLAS